MAPAAASVPRGIALMVAAMLFVPTLDAITKLLTATLPPLENRGHLLGLAFSFFSQRTV